MSAATGPTAQITDPIKIPDSGTRTPIINQRRGTGDETDQPRIEPSIAEPPHMNRTKPTSQQTLQPVAAAPFPDIDDPKLTGPERALVRSGIALHLVARRMLTWRRPTPKQVESGSIYLRRVLRHGDAGYDYAVKLAAIIGCPANWLMLPRGCWPNEALPYRGAMERGLEAGATGSSAIAGAGSAPEYQGARPRPSQMQVLRKI